MSATVKSFTVVGARMLLGLVYFVFGLNYFLHFLPTPPPPEGAAGSFTGGLFQAGYFFPMMKGIEVLLGAFLLAGLFVPISLIVLAPITINILLFHVFLAPANTAMGLVMLLLQLYLAWSYRDYFKPLFSRKATLSV